MNVRCGVLIALLFPPISLAGDKTVKIGPGGWDFSGEIQKDDPKFKMELGGKIFLMPAKQFNVELEPGYRFRFIMDTDDPKLDPFLALQDDKGKLLLFDDDGGGGLNSKFAFSRFSDKGVYRLFAASLHGHAGPFVLTVTPMARFHVEPKVRDVTEDPLVLKGDLNKERQEIHYRVRLKGGTTYRFDMTSKKVDSYLELRDDSGRLLAEDDDTGIKLGARIAKNIPKDGVYRVIASSTNLAQSGPFTLEVRED